MNRAASCFICNGKWVKIARRRPPSRLLSSARSACSASSEIASPTLCYDRDTGIIWETSSPSSSSSPSHQQPQRIQPLYQTIIGIEIHAQLAIPTKLFSSAPTRHNNAAVNVNDNMTANTFVHPYDLAYPGTLPSLSQSAVKASILSAAALDCIIHKCSRFERKHYFYPDSPNGYQITQQRWPLASDGLVTFIPYSNKQLPAQKMKEGSKKKKRTRGGKSSQEDNHSQDDSNNIPTDFEPQPVPLRIERIQIEQDTGKTTTHTITNDQGQTQTKSYIDYNRAGCALIEIVSHPDLRSAHEAAGVVEKIRKLLKHVGSCDGRMEEGSLRCDLNVSIAPIDNGVNSSNSREELPPNTGHRVEVKNLNSLRQIIAAAEYEALRQSSLLEQEGSTPTGRETRTFHVKPISDSYPLGGETFCIRAKGDAVDYRFMPEPDLPPLILDGETLGSDLSLEEFVKMYMPENPEEAMGRLVKDYGLAEDVANVITGDPPAIELFEQTVKSAMSELQSSTNNEALDKDHILPTLAANWLCNDLFALVKKSAIKGSGETDEIEEGTLNHPISVEYSTVDGKRLGALIAMIANGSLTTSMAKKVLTIMFEEDEDLHSSPSDISETNGWRVISDMDTLIDLCESVVLDTQNASQLEQYNLGGKKIWKIEKFFVGKIMAASKGNAHPERMKEALASVLENVKSRDD